MRRLHLGPGARRGTAAPVVGETPTGGWISRRWAERGRGGGGKYYQVVLKLP